MKNKLIFVLTFNLILSGAVFGQQSKINTKANSENWTAHNREVDFKGEIIHLNAKANDGILWLNGAQFKNGTVELDIKGKDVRGRSFVGLAFHGKDNNTFEGVYFRPFNFQSPERNSHSVQYISMPEYEWSVLRNKFPGKYENNIDPAPEPEEWIHTKIVVDYPQVKVYVNGAQKASLEVRQIGDGAGRKLGLWVGNGSEGWFKNMVITSK